MPRFLVTPFSPFVTRSCYLNYFRATAYLLAFWVLRAYNRFTLKKESRKIRTVKTMLNNTETVKEVSFAEQLRTLSLEQLRDKEGFLIDEILQHYDNTSSCNVSGLCDYGEPCGNCQKLNHHIEKDNFKLQVIRNEIEYQQKTTMINSCDGILQNLFENAERCGYTDTCDQEKCYGAVCPCLCHK